MTDRLVVALNALINPDNAGGSESSALSILANFRDPGETGIDMCVTALPSYAETMRALRGDPAKVIEWPWAEFTVVGSEPRQPWLKALRAKLGDGALGRAADGLIREVNNRAFLRSQPDRAAVDALLDRFHVDVVHFTYPVKWPTRRPYIFEPHDIQQYHFPEFFNADTLAWRKRTYTDGIRNSAFVVCGTWWTKRDIMKHFGVPAGRIAVVPRSSTMARADLSPKELLHHTRKMGLDEPFMYYPAMTFPHKNHLRLLEAMALLRDRRGLRLKLVCTGRAYKPFQPTLVEAVRRLGLEADVRFLGKVSEAQLAACYRASRFIVFPSLLEGHSQSLLESLFHGKPIVAARQSSVPETIGRAGLLFDALDVEAIADALERAWSDDALLDDIRSRIANSFDRYDWGRARLTLTACYKSAAGRSLSAEERGLLDRALLEYEPDDAAGASTPERTAFAQEGTR